MEELFDLKVRVNGEHTFFLDQRIISKFSGRLEGILKEEKKKTQMRNPEIVIDEFPGGPAAFELISRFCYKNGRIQITPSNVPLLHCCAIFLGMTEKVSACNLQLQTETFLEGIFYWTWSDILNSLKSCESLFKDADSSGLLEKLIISLLAKITQNSDIDFNGSSSSSSSSPDTASGFRVSSSTKTTPESIKLGSSSKVWWFDDLTILAPKIIEKVIKTMGAYGTDNTSLILTKFLLHYLKRAGHCKGGGCIGPRSEYGGLADTAVNGVIVIGKTAFSCRGLFWVLRVVSSFGISREYRIGLERLIGGMLDQATLDDLLVSGHDEGVYDVNLVLRLLRMFVSDDKVSVQEMKTVGRLIDKYMGEISPDHNLKVSKFLAVAESLPDFARDCFDGVYRAIDIYIESHPTLPFEERSRLCRCLDYEKLTLETCKDLAKNPRIPPRVAVQALLSQQATHKKKDTESESPCTSDAQTAMYQSSDGEKFSGFLEDKEEMRLNLQKMQWRVVELEKVCRDMKGQMSKLIKNKVMTSPAHTRALPRLC